MLPALTPPTTNPNFNDAERLAWLRLLRTERVGPVTFRQLLSVYGTASKALEHIGTLSKQGGRKKPLSPPPVGKIEQEIAFCQGNNIEIICLADPDYPALLAAIPDAPPIIFVRGHLHLASKPIVGMVGARNASINACNFSKQLATELGAAGQVVASGFARGIDTAAHLGSIDTGTIAVLAGGVDHIYPPENVELYAELIERGCIISENPPGMVPQASHFPRRNRLISGLSQGVVVVEAAKRSGSLITARVAGEQGRDVMAVPGFPLDPRCQGTNYLLKNGAALIENADDVLNTVGGGQQTWLLREDHNPLNNPLESLSRGINLSTKLPNEETLNHWRGVITGGLSAVPCTVSDLLTATSAPPKILHIVLLELYLANRLEHHPGGRVALVF